MGGFSKQRWILVSIFHYIALFLANQLNFHLATQSLQITILGMLVAYSSLALAYEQGLLSLVPISFYLDSSSPLPFGSTLAVVAALHAGAWLLRSRLRRETSAISLAFSITLTSVIFAAYAVIAYFSDLGGSANFRLLMLNLSASWLVVALTNHWFFAYQSSMLSLFGIRIAEEQRESR